MYVCKYACPLPSPHESCSKGSLGRSFSGQAVCVFALLSCTSGDDAGGEQRHAGEASLVEGVTVRGMLDSS